MATGAGKTTVMDAYLWLLTGMDSLNQASFEIKDIDAAGDVAHNLDHEVEAEFITDHGEKRFKKILAEKYTKKRGSATAEFTGHVTSHFLDDVPVSEKEYKEAVNQIARPALFKLLSC